MTKNLILKKTLELLTESSYSNVSMKMIAKACDISEPAIYYHFKNKNELFNNLAMSILEQSRELFKSALQLDLSLHDTLVVIADNYLTGLEDFPNFPKAYLALVTDPSFKVVVDNLQNEIDNVQLLLIQLFSREQLRGEIGMDVDVEVVCHMFRGVIIEFMMSSTYLNKTEIPESETIVQILLQGVLKR